MAGEPGQAVDNQTFQAEQVLLRAAIVAQTAAIVAQTAAIAAQAAALMTAAQIQADATLLASDKLATETVAAALVAADKLAADTEKQVHATLGAAHVGAAAVLVPVGSPSERPDLVGRWMAWKAECDRINGLKNGG
jgi:hypothetical protein